MKGSPDNLLAIFVTPLSQSELFWLCCFGGNWAQRQYASLSLRPGCAVWLCQSIPVELCQIILTASLPRELLLIGSCLTCTQCKESTTRPVTNHDVGTLCENSVPSGKVRPEREGHLSAWHLIMLPAPFLKAAVVISLLGGLVDVLIDVFLLSKHRFRMAGTSAGLLVAALLSGL